MYLVRSSIAFQLFDRLLSQLFPIVTYTRAWTISWSNFIRSQFRLFTNFARHWPRVSRSILRACTRTARSSREMGRRSGWSALFSQPQTFVHLNLSISLVSSLFPSSNLRSRNLKVRYIRTIIRSARRYFFFFTISRIIKGISCEKQYFSWRNYT